MIAERNPTGLSEDWRHCRVSSRVRVRVRVREVLGLRLVTDVGVAHPSLGAPDMHMDTGILHRF